MRLDRWGVAIAVAMAGLCACADDSMTAPPEADTC